MAKTTAGAMKPLKITVPKDYQPSKGEVDNLVYLSLKYTANWPMRAADLGVIESMRNKNLRGVAAISEIVELTCEYVWDHILGEPDDVSSEKLYEHMRKPIEHWYKVADAKARAKTT